MEVDRDKVKVKDKAKERNRFQDHYVLLHLDHSI
jgi:hypothetical protein